MLGGLGGGDGTDAPQESPSHPGRVFGSLFDEKLFEPLSSSKFFGFQFVFLGNISDAEHVSKATAFVAETIKVLHLLGHRLPLPDDPTISLTETQVRVKGCQPPLSGRGGLS